VKRTAPAFVLFILQIMFWATAAHACNHTPLEWQQPVENHAIAAMIGQQKHLTWVRDLDRNFIDDEIEARFHPGEIVNIVVDLNHCLTHRQIDALLSKYGKIQYIGKLITFVLMEGVRFENLPKIAVLPDVAMIEWQRPAQLMNDVSTRAIQARPSTTFSPNTARDIGLDGAGVNIAFVDSGVDDAHEAFAGSFVAGYDATDPMDPGDGTRHPGDPMGHGTHVAGIALGRGTPGRVCRDPGGGQVTDCSGVAPKAGLVEVRVCVFGMCDETAVRKGLDWIGTNRNKFHIRVVNQSQGFGPDDDGTNAMSQQINYLAAMGVVMVVSHGNAGKFGLMPGTARTTYPGSASLAITVAATDDRGTVDRSDDTIYSDFLVGPRKDFNVMAPELSALKPDISAPGTLIMSAQANTPSGYMMQSGTSEAAPHVAGAAALIIQKQPGITPGSLKDLLKQNADTSKNVPEYPMVDPHWDKRFGSGMLTLFPALTKASATDVKFPTCTNAAISPGGLCVLNGGLDPWDNTVDISTATPPKAGVPNTITVQVRNDGPAVATVLVNFGIYKFGAGSPLFFHIGTKPVTIQPMTTVAVKQDWTPLHSDHQCVLASIDFGLDTNFANNVTQRNLQVGASTFEMEVESPFPAKAKFELRAKSKREGWVCRVSEQTFTLDPAIDCPRKVKINFDPPKGTKPDERADCSIAVYGAPEGEDLRLIGGVTAQTFVPSPCTIVGAVVDASGNPLPGVKLQFEVSATAKESPSHQDIPVTGAETDQFGNFQVTLAPEVERLVTVEGKSGKGQMLLTPTCGQPMRFVLTPKGVTQQTCGGATSCLLTKTQPGTTGLAVSP
jgi:hypothetical protein